MRKVIRIISSPRHSHLEFLTAKRANPVRFSRNDGKDQEMGSASHPNETTSLTEIVNPLTFIFDFLPATF
jgi:hypothetical protein